MPTIARDHAVLAKYRRYEQANGEHAEQESAELRKIAGRSSERLLAYATDEDSSFGIDPEANMGDLSSDPLQFARRRLLLARELWDRWQDRELKDGESYVVLRRTVGRGLIVVGQSSATVAKYIGGVSTSRDHAGSPRPPLTPTTATDDGSISDPRRGQRPCCFFRRL